MTDNTQDNRELQATEGAVVSYGKGEANRASALRSVRDLWSAAVAREAELREEAEVRAREADRMQVQRDIALQEKYQAEATLLVVRNDLAHAVAERDRERQEKEQAIEERDTAIGALRTAAAALGWIAPWILGPSELARRNEAISTADAVLQGSAPK